MIGTICWLTIAVLCAWWLLGDYRRHNRYLKQLIMNGMLGASHRKELIGG